MENTTETRWFSFDIKGNAGEVFYTLEDLKATAELDDDGNLADVINIFTQHGASQNVYLPNNELRESIINYVENNFDDLRDDEPQGGRDDEHRLTADELGVGGKR